MEKLIEIEITPAGAATIDKVGFTGGECKEAALEHEAIYRETISRKDKPEIHVGARPIQKAGVNK